MARSATARAAVQRHVAPGPAAGDVHEVRAGRDARQDGREAEQPQAQQRYEVQQEIAARPSTVASAARRIRRGSGWCHRPGRRAGVREVGRVGAVAAFSRAAETTPLITVTAGLVRSLAMAQSDA
jgi:hypothetical protein